MAFEREDRYLVIKRSDIEKYLTEGEKESLVCISDEIGMGRADDGKYPLSAVVVEEGWPEFEPTWRAIQSRVEADSYRAPTGRTGGFMKTNSTEALAAVKERMDEAFRGMKIYSQEQARQIVGQVLCDAVIDGLITPDYPAPVIEVDVMLQGKVRGMNVEITIGGGRDGH